jgi:hypothetical protein
LKVKNNLFVGGTIQGNVINSPGDVWYVDILNGGASNSGKTWDNAFSTLALALAAAGNYDTIFIAQNAIATVTGMTITQIGLKIIGSNLHPGTQSHAMKQTAGTLPMFTIKADRVEIANLCLSQRTAYPCIQIGDTIGQAYYQIYIHDCNLEGQTGTYGITPGGSLGVASGASPVNMVVENNYFSGFTVAAIVADGDRCSYIKNTIKVNDDGIGIWYLSGAGDRPGSVIADNYLRGLAATTTKGILFAATPTAGDIILTRNYLCGTWNVTITDVAGGCMNYVTDASGGALINC